MGLVKRLIKRVKDFEEFAREQAERTENCYLEGRREESKVLGGRMGKKEFGLWREKNNRRLETGCLEL